MIKFYLYSLDERQGMILMSLTRQGAWLRELGEPKDRDYGSPVFGGELPANL